MCEMGPERYVQLNLSSGERSMVAQIRMGILPIRIETGRFTNLKIEQRLCQLCDTDKVEVRFTSSFIVQFMNPQEGFSLTMLQMM